MSELLNVDDALSQILSKIPVLNTEKIHILDALNQVAAEDILSESNLPPFANSAMDGYAVLAEDIKSASKDSPVALQVVMDIPAGSPPTGKLSAGTAARIMTGAPIPEGATAVIPVEDTDQKWQKGDSLSLAKSVNILRSASHNDNIRLVGENIKIGETVFQAGTLIRPAEIGMLAAVGCSEITVTRKPRVLILTTGDELLDIDQPLTFGKIRDSNSYTLTALVNQAGGTAIRLPIASDNLSEIRKLYQTALEHQPDMILSSAGVSVGTADLVKTVMEEMGEIGFWRINLRPGKPLAFGNIQGIPFFGLPGNPVSAMITFEVFVRPSLAKMANLPYYAGTVSVYTENAMKSDGRRTYVRVQLEKENNRLIARETGTQSSGALMSMVLADALMVIPEDVTDVPAGTALQAHLLR